MVTQLVGFGLLVVGIIVILVFLLADVLGIGRDPSVIGTIQIAGAAVGVVLAVIGGWLAFRRRQS